MSADDYTATTGSIQYPWIDVHTKCRFYLIPFLVLLPPLSLLTLVVYNRKEKNKTTFLNIQLSVVNLLTAFLLLPMFFAFYQLLKDKGANILMIQPTNDYALNKEFCQSLAILYYLITSLYFITLFGLSLDRLLAISAPLRYRQLSPFIYVKSLLVFWSLFIILPTVGVLMPDRNDGNVPFFQYLPGRFINIEFTKIYCGIRFTLEPGYDTTSYENTDKNGFLIPTIGQKIYCVLLMGIPYIIIPIVIIILTMATMIQLLLFFSRRRRLHTPKSSPPASTATVGAGCCSSSCTGLRRALSSCVDGCFPRGATRSTRQIRVEATPPKEPSKIEQPRASVVPSCVRLTRKSEYHVDAFVTLIVLLLVFFACHFLWWVQKLAETFNYIYPPINLYDKVTFLNFENNHTAIYGTFAALCGPFLYGLLLPLIMLWRQISFRQECLGLFRDAKANTLEITQIFSRARDRSAVL